MKMGLRSIFLEANKQAVKEVCPNGLAKEMERIINKMEIDKISGDTAKQILLNLIANKKVQLEEVESCLTANPNAELKRMTDLIHQLFCQVSHEDGACDYYCDYYKEEDTENIWKRDHHVGWLSITLEFMEKYNINTESALLNYIANAKMVQEKIINLKREFPASYEILLGMNGWLKEEEEDDEEPE
jgi:hypothetical protein